MYIGSDVHSRHKNVHISIHTETHSWGRFRQWLASKVIRVKSPKLHVVNGQPGVPHRAWSGRTPAGRREAAAVDWVAAGSRPSGTVIGYSHSGSMKTANVSRETPAALAPRTACGVACSRPPEWI